MIRFSEPSDNGFPSVDLTQSDLRDRICELYESLII
jgi:hypothetical protein